MAESISTKISSVENIEKIENEVEGKPSQTGQDKPELENPEEARTVSPRQSIDGRSRLQDQSNLLPMKQLIVVFAGLSCALFCESKFKASLE
jgi:hypothetical protein